MCLPPAGSMLMHRKTYSQVTTANAHSYTNYIIKGEIKNTTAKSQQTLYTRALVSALWCAVCLNCYKNALVLRLAALIRFVCVFYE